MRIVCYSILIVTVTICSCRSASVTVASPPANGGLLRGSLIKQVIRYHRETNKLPASIEDLEHQGLFPYSFNFGTEGGHARVDRSILTKYELKILPKDDRKVISIIYVIGGESFDDEYELGSLD